MIIQCSVFFPLARIDQFIISKNSYRLLFLRIHIFHLLYAYCCISSPPPKPSSKYAFSCSCGEKLLLDLQLDRKRLINCDYYYYYYYPGKLNAKSSSGAKSIPEDKLSTMFFLRQPVNTSMFQKLEHEFLLRFHCEVMF